VWHRSLAAAIGLYSSISDPFHYPTSGFVYCSTSASWERYSLPWHASAYALLPVRPFIRLSWHPRAFTLTPGRRHSHTLALTCPHSSTIALVYYPTLVPFYYPTLNPSGPRPLLFIASRPSRFSSSSTFLSLEPKRSRNIRKTTSQNAFWKGNDIRDSCGTAP